jgi:hypothetical protein
MTLRSTATVVRALDGLCLAGTLVTPGSATERAVVLVHGGGVTREEGGFFPRLPSTLRAQPDSRERHRRDRSTARGSSVGAAWDQLS